MALINPDGMFYGDRMALLSDKARLLWPHVFIASNTVGRIEINYRKVLNRAFSDFKQNPFTDEAEFMGIMGEYFDAFLLYTYEQDGQIWGQWDIDKKMLPRFPLKADTKTPEPPENEFADWKKVYRESKRTKPFNLKTFTIPPRKSVETRENASGVGVGGGIGEGVGVGKNKTLSKDKPSTDFRRKDFIEDLQKYWQSRNPEDLPFQPSAKDFKNLDVFLKDHPKIERAKFRQLLNSRARAPNTIHSEDIHRWINRILEYEHKGKSNHGKAEERNRGIENSAAEARRMRGLPARSVEVLRYAARSVPAGNGRGDTGEVSGRTIEGSLQESSGGPKRLQIPAEARGSDKADSETS